MKFTYKAALEEAKEKVEKAKNKKFYMFEYSYTRYNPQLGENEHSSTVIAKTEKEAIKLAKERCEGGVYGYNAFNFISAKSDQLVYGVDFELEASVREKIVGRGIRFISEVKVIAKSSAYDKLPGDTYEIL